MCSLNKVLTSAMWCASLKTPDGKFYSGTSRYVKSPHISLGYFSDDQGISNLEITSSNVSEREREDFKTERESIAEQDLERERERDFTTQHFGTALMRDILGPLYNERQRERHVMYRMRSKRALRRCSLSQGDHPSVLLTLSKPSESIRSRNRNPIALYFNSNF